MRTKNHHLARRGGSAVWQYDRWVPEDVRREFGQARLRISLKTRDDVEARRLRNDLDKKHEAEWEKIRRRLIAMGANNQPSFPSEDQAIFAAGQAERAPDVDITPTLDVLTDQIDRLAHQHMAEQGLGQEEEDAARDHVMEHLPEGRALARKVKLYHGEASYAMLGERLFEVSDLKPSTVKEYGRALKAADEALPPAKSVTRQEVQAWVNGLSRRFNADTIKKMLSAIRASLKQSAIPTDPFDKISVRSKKRAVKRKEWTDQEIAALLTACHQPWLRDAILIAAHTGARQGVLPLLTYDPSADTITFPAAKREEEARTLPCPDAIRPAVLRWLEEERSSNSISNEFTKLKKRVVGDDPDRKKVFHSFRHTALSRLMESGVDRVVAMYLAGHKQSTDILETYYTKLRPEPLREPINRLRYQGLDRWLG